MKNNNLIENSLVTEKEVGKSNDFPERLDEVKDKIVKLREKRDEYLGLQKQFRNLGEEFLSEYGSSHKPEMLKLVNWLQDLSLPNELVSIFGNSIDYNHRKNVTDLVDRLFIYENYKDTFDSIEIRDSDNCLSQYEYLISEELHDLLENGYKVTRDRTVVKKDKSGMYLVVFSSVKYKGKDVLVYNYIRYPSIFTKTLYNYIRGESFVLFLEKYKSIGLDYLFVLDYSIENKNIFLDEVSRISESFNWKREDKNLNQYLYPKNILDICKFILHGCPLFVYNENIGEFIKNAWQKNNFVLVEQMVDLYGFYGKSVNEGGWSYLQESLIKVNLDKYNFLGRLVFLTSDLNGLIENVKNTVDNDVNEGPQAWRGQSNSLNYTLGRIDTDYRASLNRHNQYHVNARNIPRSAFLGKNKFSYQNIHKNLGYVRFYSTERYVSKKFAQPVIKDTRNMYYEIGDIIKNSPVNEDTQLKIENSLYDFSYLDLLEKSKEDKPLIDYSLINKKFSMLLLEERDKLDDYINRTKRLVFKKVPEKENDKILYLLNKVLSGLENDYVITVINGRFFKIVSQYNVSIEYNRCVNIFVDIGRDLFESYCYNLYIHQKKLNSKEYKLSDWKSENSALVDMFTNSLKAGIGAKVIGWLQNLDLVRFELITTGKKEKENFIVPTKRVIALLDKETIIKPLPRRLPMIVRPKLWERIKLEKGVKEILGGYLLNDEKYVRPLLIPKWNFGKPTLIKDENLVYDLVNNVNSVGYKVNKDLLEFIGTYGLEYGLVINSAYIHPLSLKPKLNKAEYAELTSFLSQKDLQESILILAELYSTKHEFFIPTNLDFRGRLYCVSEYLNYQSTELAKALLLFSKGEKLYKSDKTSINYLKAYGANCYGNKLDKMSWKMRCEWVDENIENIVNFKNGELIKKAEKKLLFTAFCFEYNKYLDSLNNSSDYFETHLPIQLDATCNGYQHLSLLSLDHDLAKELNLTKSSWTDKPKDFYGYTAVKLRNYFKDRIADNNLKEEEIEAYTRLSDLTVARKIVKKCIMTIPYNATFVTIVDYLKEHFDPCEYDGDDWKNKMYYFKDDSSVILKLTDFNYLAKGIRIVLFDDRFKLKKLLTYLNEVVDVLCELGLTVSWGTPNSGVLIEQSYLHTKEERLKPFAYTKKTFKVKVVDETKTKYTKKQQKVSFLPNLIHSLDAAALALLVYYFFEDKRFGVKNIYTIHDCFAVTANNISNLAYMLNHVYQKIYTEKTYLKEFDTNMINHIKFNCKKTIEFNPKTLTITRKEDGKVLDYPSVKKVLGVNNAEGLVKQSSYLIH